MPWLLKDQRFAFPPTSQAPVTVLTEDPRHRPHRSHRDGSPAGHGSGPSGQARETRNRPPCHPPRGPVTLQHLPLTTECQVPSLHPCLPGLDSRFSVSTHWTLPGDKCFENKSRTPAPQIPQSYQTAVTAMSSHQTLAETDSTIGVTRGTPRHCAP